MYILYLDDVEGLERKRHARPAAERCAVRAERGKRGVRIVADVAHGLQARQRLLEVLANLVAALEPEEVEVALQVVGHREELEAQLWERERACVIER